jgi:hypothetical protein
VSLAWIAESPAVPPREIHDKVADIFSRPEFEPSRRPFSIWEFLLRHLDEFFKMLAGLSSAAPVLYWVLVVGLSLILILLLTHIAYTIYRVVTFSSPDSIDARRAARLHRSSEYAALARSRADAGDYTEAIRHLFLALVFRFDERGRVVLRPAVTNREYLHQLGDQANVQRELAFFVDTLDDHWYGQRPAHAAQYEQCQSLYQRLVAG